MCGRFALSAKTKQIEKLVPGIKSEIEIIPRYNIAPSQNVLSVLNGNSLQLNFLKWGLINLLPIFSSFDQNGIKPHFVIENSGLLLFKTDNTF